MATTGLEPFLKGDGGRNTRGMLRIIILCTIAAAAVASRLFSVIRKSAVTIIYSMRAFIVTPHQHALAPVIESVQIC